MLNTVVIGGPPDFVMGSLKHKLRHEGIQIIDHWDFDRQPKDSIPQKTDFLLSLSDMMGHHFDRKAKELAKRHKIPYVIGNRKWSHLRQVLRDQGLLKAKTITLPTTSTEMDASEKSIELQKFLAIDPFATNNKIQMYFGEVFGVKIANEIIAHCRAMMGINVKNWREPTINRHLFTSTAERIGVTPVDIPVDVPEFTDPPPVPEKPARKTKEPKSPRPEKKAAVLKKLSPEEKEKKNKVALEKAIQNLRDVMNKQDILEVRIVKENGNLAVSLRKEILVVTETEESFTL